MVLAPVFARPSTVRRGTGGSSHAALRSSPASRRSTMIGSRNRSESQKVDGASRRRAAPGSQPVLVRGAATVHALRRRRVVIGQSRAQCCAASASHRVLAASSIARENPAMCKQHRVRPSCTVRAKPHIGSVASTSAPVKERANPTVKRSPNGGVLLRAPEPLAAPLVPAYCAR